LSRRKGWEAAGCEMSLFAEMITPPKTLHSKWGFLLPVEEKDREYRDLTLLRIMSKFTQDIK
jgi:hypothetical protein